MENIFEAGQKPDNRHLPQGPASINDAGNFT